MKRVIVNPKETQPMYDGFHFSQANRVGDTIWVSGQVGVDDKLTPASGMAAQARLAFEGLKRTLVAAGATLDDVVELTTFARRLARRDGAIRESEGRIPSEQLSRLDRG